MQITEKDKTINTHIEKYGFATVKQIANIFFNDSAFKGQQAYKRLKALLEYGYIKQYKSVNCSQNIYAVSDKYKRQTLHNIIALDVICKFIECKSIKILDAKRERVWANGKVISDAFVTIKYTKGIEVFIQSFIVEIHTSNNKWQKTLEKYNNKEVIDDILKSTPGGDKGIAPTLIFVDSVTHNFESINCPFKITQIDSSLTDFPFVFNT